jgi:hypothetical protein
MTASTASTTSSTPTTPNIYNLNAYDAVVALILTQYLRQRDYKAELGKVIGSENNKTEIDGPGLADILDRSMAWAKGMLTTSSDEPLTGELIDTVKEVISDFSGTRYVQAMDAGFAEMLDDFYHDRIRKA